MFPALNRLFDKVWPLPAGQIRDPLSSENLPAAENISGVISPECSSIPFDSGITLPGELHGFDVRLYRKGVDEESDTEAFGHISEAGRDQLLTELRAQIEADGKITKLPDITQLDGYCEN